MIINETLRPKVRIENTSIPIDLSISGNMLDDYISAH